MSEEISTADIKEMIQRRRHQILIHSCIYYAMDDNIVSDDQWQQWANELAELQDKYPECCKIKFFDREFVAWDGTSGAFLPLKNEWVWNKALYMLELHKQMDNEISDEPEVKRPPTKREIFEDLFE